MPQSQTCRQENAAILTTHEDGGVAIIRGNPDNKLNNSNRKEHLSKHHKHDHQKEPHKDHHAPTVKDEEEIIDRTSTPPKSAPHEPPKKHKLRLKAVKSRELRGGVVYYDCDCYHRNGLQHDCPRGGCGGLNHCVAKPWPHCDLSRYFKDKWGNYHRVLDSIPPTTYCGPKDALCREEMEREINSQAHEKNENSNEPQEKAANTRERLLKPDKNKDHKPKKRQSQENRSGRCRTVHENVVKQYAIIPIGPA